MADADNADRTTLIGVVSAGAGCGQGVPSLYSKVSFHIKWIRCIIDKSVQFNNNQEKVVRACKDTVKPQPTCVKQNELVFGLKYFQDIKSKSLELCKDPTTISSTTEENIFDGLFDYDDDDSLFDGLFDFDK